MRLIITFSDRRKSRTWKDTYYPIIAGFALGLVSTMFIPWLILMANTQPDYTVILDPSAGTASTLQTINTTVIVNDDYDLYHSWHNYKNQITLIANEIDGKTSYSRVKIEFEEPIITINSSRQNRSTIFITPTENAAKGHYIVEIKAKGGDGKVKSVLYDLEVN
jgi:hypothetical protein